LAPIAVNIRLNKGITCGPLSWIGTPSKRTLSKDIPVSTGGPDTMCRAIRSSASGLTAPPVARVPLAGRGPRHTRPPPNSRSGRKSNKAIHAARRRQKTVILWVLTRPNCGTRIAPTTHDRAIPRWDNGEGDPPMPGDCPLGNTTVPVLTYRRVPGYFLLRPQFLMRI
jgi:hypothetical protein